MNYIFPRPRINHRRHHGHHPRHCRPTNRRKSRMQLILANNNAQQRPNNRQTNEQILQPPSDKSDYQRSNANHAARPKSLGKTKRIPFQTDQQCRKVGNRGDANPTQIYAKSRFQQTSRGRFWFKIKGNYGIQTHQTPQNTQHDDHRQRQNQKMPSQNPTNIAH